MIRILILLGLLFAPQLVHAEWYEASTAHFIVYANDTEAHVRTYATGLERFDRALRVLRGIADRPIGPGDRVTVYVVRNDDEIESLSRQGVRGFYQADVAGPVAFVPRRSGDGDKWDLDADSVLRHEYAHHFMFDNYQIVALPLWFVEGFAEFYATAITQNDGSVTIGQAPAYRAYALLANYGALSTIEVLTADKRKLSPEQRDTLYGKGWLLMHYLTFDTSRRGQLESYLKAVSAGTPAAEAAGAFGDLKQLDRDLKRYLNKPTISGLTIPASALAVQSAAIRRLTDGEAAMMAIRVRSKAGVTDKTAPALFARARKEAAPYPDDPGAQLVLAETACDANDDAACIAAAERVIARDPKNQKAYVFRGRAIMAAAQRARPLNVEAFRTARKSFVVANHLEPDEPEALAYYYRSYVAGGERPTAPARAALHKALELAPEDENLRGEVVADYLQAGDKPNARQALLPLAYAPHGGEGAVRAAALLSAIDQNDDAAIDRILHQPVNPDAKDKPEK